MTETMLTGQLKNQALMDLRGCKIIKHADRATKGVPDTTISWMAATNWIENKLQRKGQSLADICNLQQLIFAHELEVTTGGRCWVTVYREDPKDLTIWSPRVLASTIWPRVVGAQVKAPAQVVDWDEPCNLYDVIQASGAVRCRGWSHRFVTKMIKDRVRHGA